MVGFSFFIVASDSMMLLTSTALPSLMGDLTNGDDSISTVLPFRAIFYDGVSR